MIICPLLSLANCCPGDLVLASTSTAQTSRLGMYKLTSPLQTTTRAEKTFPVFEKPNNFLFVHGTNVQPWLIGPAVGGGGGYFFDQEQQCPEYVRKAYVYAGSTTSLAEGDWSWTCHAGL